MSSIHELSNAARGGTPDLDLDLPASATPSTPVASQPPQAQGTELTEYVPSPEAGVVGRVLERAIARATEGLRPGGHVELMAMGGIGGAVGIGQLSVSMTAEHHYELTVATRGGPAVGAQENVAQGTAMATLGGSLTHEFPDREGLVHAVSALAQACVQGASLGHPLAGALTRWLSDGDARETTAAVLVDPSRAALSVQVDAIGLADLTPAELRGNLTGPMELRVDFKRGTVLQRMEMGAGTAGGLMLSGALAGLVLKGNSDNAEVSATGQLAFENRFEIAPDLLRKLRYGQISPAAFASQLVHARRVGEPTVLGTVRVSSGGVAVTASRSVPLTEALQGSLALVQILDPRRARYTVESSRNAQLTLSGGAGPAAFKLVGARTEPVFRAENVPWNELREKIEIASKAP